MPARSESALTLICGNEPLLLEERLNEIRAELRNAGFDEHVRHSDDAIKDWEALFADAGSASLFSAKRLLELRLVSGKPNAAAGKALARYCATPNPDLALIVIAGALDKTARKAAWVQACTKIGRLIECPALPPARLPAWLNQRIHQLGAKLDPEAAERLAAYVEGNLLAAQQQIALLALLYPKQTIRLAEVERLGVDQAQFSPFALADACLAGQPERSLRILHSLRRSQVAALVVLRILEREVRLLTRIHAAGRNAPLQKFGVWSSRIGLVQKARQRLSYGRCRQLLSACATLDLQAKGALPAGDLWHELERVVLGVCSDYGGIAAAGINN